MSEKNSGYNPEGLSEEEMKKIDEAEAEKRKDLIAGMFGKDKPKTNVVGAEEVEEKAGLRSPSGVLLEPKSPRPTLPAGVKKGFRVHHEKPGASRSKKKIEDKELSSNSVNKEIKKILKQFIFKGGFKLVVSHENKGNYIFQLLIRPERSVKYETELEFEDKLENIASRVQEYMDNTYDKLL